MFIKEYTYGDFLHTLDETGQAVLIAINDHISSLYSQYKPFDVKPTDKSEKEWVLNYRKKPKVGKAVCSANSINGKLSVRFCFLSSMTYEFLQRQNEFSGKLRVNALKQIICVVNKSCRAYGGTVCCAWRQYYWINKHLVMTCPYPWVYLNDLDENDLADIKLLIDMQLNHMVQDSKDIKGGTYTEVNAQRCKEVQVIDMEAINPDSDGFQNARLIKYAKAYNLVPMGENNGLWFYHGDKTPHDSRTEIPKGRYAAVTIEDPFTFSFNRVWNYICKWALDNEETVTGITISNGVNTACFIKFFTEGAKEHMSVYVPCRNERERENIGFDEEICFNYERSPMNESKFFADFYQYTNKKLEENDLVNLKLLKSKDGKLFPTTTQPIS